LLNSPRPPQPRAGLQEPGHAGLSCL
jgi:hypothetical protein